MPTYWDPCPGKTKAILPLSLTFFFLPFGRASRFFSQGIDLRFDPPPNTAGKPILLFLAAGEIAEYLTNVPVNVLLHRFARNPDGILDGPGARAAMRDNSDSSQTKQRSASVLGIVEPAIRFAERMAAE